MMNRHTGQKIDLYQHIHQSIADILTTPIGSRIMRETYGSLLPELIDAPLNRSTLLRLYAAAVMAIIQWEPRVRISRIVDNFGHVDNANGKLTLTIYGQIREEYITDKAAARGFGFEVSLTGASA